MSQSDQLVVLIAELNNALRELGYWQDEIEELQDRIQAIEHGQIYQAPEEEQL